MLVLGQSHCYMMERVHLQDHILTVVSSFGLEVKILPVFMAYIFSEKTENHAHDLHMVPVTAIMN